MPTSGADVKNEKQYEALKDKGMSKERAAKIANVAAGALESWWRSIRTRRAHAAAPPRAARTAQKKARRPQGAARPLRVKS